MGTTAYSSGLDRTPANHVPLSPIGFLDRSADVYPDRVAIIHGKLRQTWSQTRDRCYRLASALVALGVQRGDTVSILAPNTPAMLEAHFGVPLSGAVLNAINCRLDAESVAFILRHGEASVMLVDSEFAALAARAVERLENPPLLIGIHDPEGPAAASIGALDYESLLADGDPSFKGVWPTDEWDPIALNYTSGTTGDPKGVVPSHRGTYLMSLLQLTDWPVPRHPAYLWTLPMFHANGWCFTWAITAAAGTHVCLRKVTAQAVFDAIAEHGVDHFCAAPTVMAMLTDAPPRIASHCLGVSGYSRRVRPAGSHARDGHDDGLRCGSRLRHHGGIWHARQLCKAGWLGRAAREAEGTAAVPSGRSGGGPRGTDGRRLRHHAARAARWRHPRRNHDSWQHGDEGIPEEPGEHRESLRRRMVPHR